MVQVVFYTCSFSQNLIVNGGFEEDGNDPIITRYREDTLLGSGICQGWFSASKATPDFWNSNHSRFRAFALVKAHSGEGRLGLYLAQKKFKEAENNYHEYAETKLSEPLKAGATYCLTFYVAYEKRNKFMATDIGAYFSNDSLLNKTDNVIEVTPQINFYDSTGIMSSNNWLRFTAVYKAKGGEKFLTIGNFNPAYAVKVRQVYHRRNFKATWCQEFHHYSYYYLDDISLVPSTQKQCDVPEAAGAPPHYVLLLDVSKSMLENNKLDSLKKATLNFIQQLPPTSVVSIITFSEKSSTLLKATPVSDVKSIAAAIDTLQTTGATNFNAGLHAGYDIAYSAKENVSVIVVTDGVFPVNGNAKKLILKSFDKNHSRLSAIQIGGERNSQLAELCLATSGHYNISGHLNSLSAVFKPGYLFRESNQRISYYHGSIPLISLTPLKYTGIVLAALAVYEVIKSGQQ